MNSFDTESIYSPEADDLDDCENRDLISGEECRKYLKQYDLSDERILAIRNNLIAIVDSLFNSYLEQFK